MWNVVPAATVQALPGNTVPQPLPGPMAWRSTKPGGLARVPIANPGFQSPRQFVGQAVLAPHMNSSPPCTVRPPFVIHGSQSVSVPPSRAVVGGMQFDSSIEVNGASSQSIPRSISFTRSRSVSLGPHQRSVSPGRHQRSLSPARIRNADMPSVQAQASGFSTHRSVSPRPHRSCIYSEVPAVAIQPITPRMTAAAPEQLGLSKDISISRLASGALDATLRSLSVAFGQSDAFQEKLIEPPSPTGSAPTNAPPSPAGTINFRLQSAATNRTTHTSSTFSLPMVLVVH